MKIPQTHRLQELIEIIRAGLLGSVENKLQQMEWM
jgi:hypothetical protein